MFNMIVDKVGDFLSGFRWRENLGLAILKIGSLFGWF